MPTVRQQSLRKASAQVKKRKARRTAPDDKVSVGTSQVARGMLEKEQNTAIDPIPTKREEKKYQLKQASKRKKEQAKYDSFKGKDAAGKKAAMRRAGFKPSR
tara:strand:- start:87 stop:392 length:306 start_codon:yes stop_codon:yes gene_type:complete